ncbi:uncharacterized protein PAC_04701 [Phialocephala subalpina]|uniref:Xylanolytic transcriptional activator regulatory domain-containing protein n=1 Tax=Phialocephala subalpina TaxID=576137 RepID=A0A1L7WPX1_9HELO|nr:uncharacterized protein PAC_04701 [Phialocephala subalpina]
MSSQSPPDRDEYPYPRIRRISQACLNCRSGASPQALFQCPTLTYKSLGGRRPSAQDQLATRISAFEGKLDELLSTMNKFLPMFQNQRGTTSVLSTEGTHPNSVPYPFSSSHIKTPSASYQAISNVGGSLIELPPGQVASSLIDLYFSRVHNQPYSFFHEQSFRQRYANGLVPEYLIFAMLASSLRFSTDAFYQTKQQDIIMAYASRSWSYIVQEWFATESDPDLQICQAITLLSIIDFTAGRRHPGWMKIGLCIRIAQELGLMLEPDSSLSISDREERRRVFWSIYTLDKLCSCGRARPSAILDAQCQVQLPGHEIDFRNGISKKTQTLKQAFSTVDTQDERPSHLALVVLVASIIGKCAQHMIHDHGRTEGCLPPWDSKSDFAMIHSTLLQLETQFEIGNNIEEAVSVQECCETGVYDMQIVGPTIFAYALFYTSQCLLHHPFLLYQQSKSRGAKPPASFLSRALQSGRENAYLMSKLLVDAEAMGCSVVYSFFGYCTTVCASIHTMYLNHQNIECHEQARQCLTSQRAFLEQYAMVWSNGKNMIGILDKLVSQPSLILAVVVATPRFELLDREQVVDLWAAVDYTTMSQEAMRSAASRASMDVLSPVNWDSVFGANGNTNTIGGDSMQGSSADGAQGGRLTVYNGAMPPGMSPFSTFFNDAGLNFGA